MVSNDEIRKKLKEKKEGLDSNGFYCPECGTKNSNESVFCKECGASLKVLGVEKEIKERTPKTSDFPKKNPKLAKIPGFRTGTGWKMILGLGGYFLIALLIVFVLLVALININVATSVNSAFYSNNLAGININQVNNQSLSSNTSTQKFLIMNISVKNNGNGKVTINPNDFSIVTSNKSANSKIYTGNTSIDSIEVVPGENKSMIIAFIIPENITPNTLKYSNFWDLGSEGINANIGNIAANQTPINGQYSLYTDKGEYKWTGGSKTVEKTINVSYEYLNEPFTISYSSTTTLTNGTSFSFSTTTNQSIKQTNVIKMISPTESSFDISSSHYISITTGTITDKLSTSLQDATGVYKSSIIINPILTIVGSSVPLTDSNRNIVGSEKLVRSEVIEIMGQKFDCWVTEIKSNSQNEETTAYYDKTTKLLLKKVQKYTVPGSSDVTYTGETILTATNIPLVGIKT